MSAVLEIDPENLARLAWLNGHKGVAGLSRAVGKHRVTIYRAVKQPKRYGPTFRAIKRALPRRSPNA